ncbi:hypothetical protein C2845_PM18G09780 [Panicum miliaceum]|uniref:RING-type domain-containing protein n=1 Tax=Panicum miliaceum TaxID=4540 RepID=A0A3L6PJ35_PANMI|nr:hypothetical protein C2845_PM18G09780 [Panicum miliaceum]
MPMLAAVTCLARRRRMHCRGSDTAAALELDLGRDDHRHRWPDEPAPVGMPGREHTGLPRAPLPHASRRQGRRRVPRDGGPPALGSRRRRETVAAGAEQTPTQEEARSQPGPGSSSAAEDMKKAADACRDARGGEGTASAPSSPVLCAVCLEGVRGRGEAAEAEAATTTLPCSDSYHPGCVLPWLAAHGACPCCRAAVPSPENYC